MSDIIISTNKNLYERIKIMFRKSMVFLLVLTMLLGLPSVAYAEESVPQRDGYVLDFSTEFNDGNLNTEYWLPQYLPHCTANTEHKRLLGSAEPG